MHNEYFSFGDWMRQRRRALRLTQSELGRRVGCATITITKIERDERRPSAQVALLLARHLAIRSELHQCFVAVARGGLAVDQLDHPIIGAEQAILFELDRTR